MNICQCLLLLGVEEFCYLVVRESLWDWGKVVVMGWRGEGMMSWCSHHWSFLLTEVLKWQACVYHILMSPSPSKSFICAWYIVLHKWTSYNSVYQTFVTHSPLLICWNYKEPFFAINWKWSSIMCTTWPYKAVSPLSKVCY